MNETTTYRAYDPITGAMYAFHARAGESHSNAWRAAWKVATDAR